MGWYSIVKPCVVGKLHYATVPVQPIQVDDEVASPLVEEGALVPYAPTCASPLGWSEDAVQPETSPYAELGDIADDVRLVNPSGEEVDHLGKPRPRSRRKVAGD